MVTSHADATKSYHPEWGMKARGDNAIGIEWRPSESDRVTLADETFDQRDQRLTSAGQDELLNPRIPVELEAGGSLRDPDLMQGRIGLDLESCAGMIELHVQDAVLFLHFECDVLMLAVHDEMALQPL
jgi:hypothetical protein